MNFLDRVEKNTQISNFTKIYPVRAELLHADGQSDMTKLTVAFRNFANVPTKGPTMKKIRKFQEARNTTGQANMTPAKNYGVCVDMQQTGVIQPTDQICQTTRLLTSYVKECIYTYYVVNFIFSIPCIYSPILYYQPTNAFKLLQRIIYSKTH